MDLGATLCTRSRPACGRCPMQTDCVAHAQDRTTELPVSKPRKAIPQKTTMMLIVQNNGEVLLEKRQSTGIWGGLWSFPEITLGEDPVAACAARYGIAVRPKALMPLLNHVFTHFRLAITPQPLQFIKTLPQVNEQQHVWLNMDDALGAAIPTPVRKLLGKMREASE